MHAPVNLERLYPTSCDDCGVLKSCVGPEAEQRHRDRYLKILAILRLVARGDETVKDVGCGSGYGLPLIKEYFDDVVGVDIAKEARVYARHHYPGFRILSKAKPREIVMMVESMEHMSLDQIKEHTRNAKILAITTPLGETVANEHHTQTFNSMEEVIRFVELNLGFREAATSFEYPIKLTTGAVATQFYGVFVR